MPRISFAWAVITQSHQIKNVCGEFPKAVSSPCLVTSFSLNLDDSNKRVQSALGQSPYQCELPCTFCPLFWNLAECLARSMGCRNHATSIAGLELGRPALHLSALFTSGYCPVSLSQSFSMFNLSNPFHLFQFKLQIYMFHLSHKILKSAIQLRSSRRKLSHPTTRLRLCSPLARNWMKRLLSQRPCHRSHGWHPTIPRHIPERGQAKFRWQHLARISWFEDTLSRFVVGSCCDNQPKIFRLHRFH